MSPDDLKRGKWVFIRQVIEDQQGWKESDPFIGMMNMRNASPLKALIGIPLKIVAVQLPFIAVRRAFKASSGGGGMFAMFCYGDSESPNERQPTILDVRELELIPASPAWVRAFRGKSKKKKPGSQEPPKPRPWGT